MNKRCNRNITHLSRSLLALSTAAMLAGMLTPAQAQDSPWDSVRSQRKTGTTQGTFSGKQQTTGTYAHKITVYKLDDANYSQGDWYRIDLSMETAISNYRKGSSVCGWYIDKAIVAFDLTTSGGEIWELGPPTTSGSSSTSFSVGGMLGSSGPRITASYSMTQTVPDAGIKLMRNTVNETAIWIASLQGCKNVGSPVNYKGASKISKSSFTLNPSLVVKVPEGRTLAFKTVADGQANGFVHQKDKFRLSKGSVTHYKAEQDFTYKVTCTGSSCTISKT